MMGNSIQYHNMNNAHNNIQSSTNNIIKKHTKKPSNVRLSSTNINALP